MSASAVPAGATAGQNRLQGHPRPEALTLHRPGHAAKAVKRGGPRATSPMSELAQLMEEPAGGANHGWKSTTAPEDALRNVRAGQVPLGADAAQHFQFLRDGGWTIVHEKDGSRAGVNAHRGALHPDEYVNPDTLRALVERELGFTYEQIRSVYRQGPLTTDQRELRGRIDARVLALSLSGANVVLLGHALGFPVKSNGNCRAMENALARARKEAM